ncbi:hypothetical protein SAMN02745121_07822 [Nannocystis exedens]|uniref:Uncharacterized protein n=1 Tax=Nannocystis exedens TaxID=54 RepID=A0A1I2HA97_9BACT|nr:hypothetical protein [Nannocystis exedens]PCC70051.1 hypothetical protein NAEX_03084 [Nannocystis exedens]SFF26592.1 hypothetical protein SAMN02745121_07822 [Nannocystis exedens]
MPRLSLGLWLVLVFACGESPREVYTQGMKAEGEAERGPCKLVFDPQIGQNVISGDQIQSCLKGQEEALALYDKASALGLKDLDFERTRERARERAKRLQGMLTTLRELEQPEYPGGKAP